MIRNEEDLAIVRLQLSRVEEALEGLRSEVYPKNPRNFAIFAEAYLDQIAELKVTINAYLGTIPAPSHHEQIPSSIPLGVTHQG